MVDFTVFDSIVDYFGWNAIDGMSTIDRGTTLVPTTTEIEVSRATLTGTTVLTSFAPFSCLTP
ncbi:MAG: hypothetical protein L7V86_07110 [Verrucomicrobiales bacterium]|nr:hypothetical protein [Verrucomicrobiales bacterium]